MALGKKTGGRQKGTPNKRSNEHCVEWANRYGLEFLEAIAEGRIKQQIVKLVGKGANAKEVKIERELPMDLRSEVARYLVDQGLGKAPQRLQHEGGGDSRPLKITLVPFEKKP